MSTHTTSRQSHTRAIVLALFVTVLWSSSWVLIKKGLVDIPPLTFAGLRYSIAFICLFPFVLQKKRRVEIRRCGLRDWGFLVLLGIVFYTVTQGAQFLALSYLPAQTTSLFLSFSPVLVAVASVLLIGEKPSVIQVAGVLVYLVGAALFLLPVTGSHSQWVGFFVAGIGVVANASASVLGRFVNRELHLSPIAVTVVSMGVGGTILLVGGIAVQGMPVFTIRSWGVILWLAVVNTALAFTMWNASLKNLSALESSVINGTMLIQIAVLAWVFLGEVLNTRQIVGLAIAATGTLLVQIFTSPGYTSRR